MAAHPNLPEDMRLLMPIAVTPELLEALAARVAAILADRSDPPVTEDTWIDAEAAARYLGYGADDLGRRRGRQRVYDLVSQRRLRFAKDGSRLLFRRSWLDDYLQGRTET